MEYILAIACIACLLAGIFIGYALSRKQAGEHVVEIKPRKQGAAEETLLSDPFTRALYTDEEIAAQMRIPTIQG